MMVSRRAMTRRTTRRISVVKKGCSGRPSVSRIIFGFNGGTEQRGVKYRRGGRDFHLTALEPAAARLAVPFQCQYVAAAEAPHAKHGIRCRRRSPSSVSK